MSLPHIAVLAFIAVGLFIGLAMLSVGFLLNRREHDAAKTAPYECGFEPFEDARVPFDVRYYLVAIVFIVFDLEFAFFFPWALVLKEIGAPALIAMALFLGVLVAGFIYEWKQGALEWE
ncbi:MAG: NADH-quinone oxidoreductase subunit A [Candidatus Porifericomitaceae bacterium WSBS_2022_MAG_OTU9]